MQKIDITVKDKMLDTTSSYHIASGSINDCYVSFHFEPGYGWEDLDITAVFTRTDQRAYKANIQPDTYYAIPTSVLTRPGTIYVGLIGCKDGDTLVTSTTTTFVVERNAMNILDTDLYPVDDDGNLDSSAYAQYVAAVNEAANRAELAANKAESIGIGWYTKAECDDRFAKKATVSISGTGLYDLSTLVEGTTPTITVNAAAALNVVGSIASPAKLSCIDKVRIRVASDNSSTELTYGGFELRRLSDTCFDSLVISSKGVTKNENVYKLSLADNYGDWVNDTTYRVSLVTAPEINVTRVNEVIANVGDCIQAVSDSYIDLTLPNTTTVAQIKAIEIWYPLLATQSTLVSAAGMNALPSGAKSLLVFSTLDDEDVPATFTVLAELNMPAYVNSLVSKVVAANSTITDLTSRLTTLEASFAKMHATQALTIEKSIWSNSDGVSSTQVNIKNSYPFNLQVEGDHGWTSIDFSYKDNDNGFVVSYTGEPKEAILIYSL